MKLHIPEVKRDLFARKSFGVMGPRLSNDIPDKGKQFVDTETFKKKLKTYLFDEF